LDNCLQEVVDNYSDRIFVVTQEIAEAWGIMNVPDPVSNYLSLNRNEFLEEMLTTDAWANFLRWELDFCAEDGCLDGGTHIISVIKKTNI
jgi:predicted secreted protein